MRKSTRKTSSNLEPPTSNGASLIFATRWGWMGLAASAKGIRTIVLAKSSRHAVERELTTRGASSRGPRGTRRQKNGSASLVTRHALREAQRQVMRYLAGRSRTLDFPIDLSGGTPFQRRVWQAALRIPYGRARSYHWIASKVGGRKYARAVGNALGTNPVPLIVPCHRVVAHDASLGGFSGGLKTKRRLLKLEGTLPLLKR